MNYTRRYKKIIFTPALRIDYAERALVESWRLLYNYHSDYTYDIEDLKEVIWKYVEESGIELFKKCDSSLFDIYSKIDECEDESREITFGHFTHNGIFLGNINELGGKPVLYEGNFQVTRDLFDIDLTYMGNYTLYGKSELKIVDLFVPKAQE